MADARTVALAELAALLAEGAAGTADVRREWDDGRAVLRLWRCEGRGGVTHGFCAARDGAGYAAAGLATAASAAEELRGAVDALWPEGGEGR